MADEARSIADLFSLFGSRRPPASSHVDFAAAGSGETAFTTKALQKFVFGLQGRSTPVILDLGSVVGPNLTFFGEQLGCRIRVEDLATDIDRHVSDGVEDRLPRFLSTRFSEPMGSFDGILCWDLFDYLDRPAAQMLAGVLSALLRPGGCLLAFFSNVDAAEPSYTKYVIIDDGSLHFRPYPGKRLRRRGLLNGDVIKLFKDLKVTDSFLMKSNVREMLFRKPTTPV